MVAVKERRYIPRANVMESCVATMERGCWWGKKVPRRAESNERPLNACQLLTETAGTWHYVYGIK
jgi:hypothetical protein